MHLWQNHRWLVALVGSLVTAIVLLAGYISVQLILTPAPQPEAGGVAFVQQDDYDGITPIEPPRPMPDFTLTDQTGDSLALNELQGTPTLITFGFTHCPDVCPLTLQEFERIRRDLGASADAVDYVFISVDGERDTPQAITRYFQTQGVDDFAYGLTGSEERVRQLGVDYGLEFIYGTPDDNGNYSVDHTAGMFLLDENQQWVRRYAFGTDVDLIADDIQSLLNDTLADA